MNALKYFSVPILVKKKIKSKGKSVGMTIDFYNLK